MSNIPYISPLGEGWDLYYTPATQREWRFRSKEEWIDWAKAIINSGAVEVINGENIGSNGVGFNGFLGHGKVYSMLVSTTPMDLRFYVCPNTGTVYLEDRESLTILAIKTLDGSYDG